MPTLPELLAACFSLRVRLSKIFFSIALPIFFLALSLSNYGSAQAKVPSFGHSKKANLQEPAQQRKLTGVIFSQQDELVPGVGRLNGNWQRAHWDRGRLARMERRRRDQLIHRPPLRFIRRMRVTRSHPPCISKYCNGNENAWSIPTIVGSDVNSCSCNQQCHDESSIFEGQVVAELQRVLDLD